MAESLKEWVFQLKARFAVNISTTLEAVDKMTHLFEKEDTLTLQEYLTRKQGLYQEAGEIDKDKIVQCLYSCIDPILQSAISLCSGASANTLHNFIPQVYSYKIAARANWKQT